MYYLDIPRGSGNLIPFRIHKSQTMSGKATTLEVNRNSREQGEVPQDLYRAIFSHSREPIAIIDLQGNYLEQNAAHAELLGYSDDELKNQTPAIHLGEQVFAEVARELAETGQYRGEVLSRTKVGETRHIELSAFVMRSDSGEPLCFVGIKRDITQRKQAERALLRSESQLTDFFENAALGLHWLGPDGTLLRVNQAELDMLGYAREEYEGHHIAPDCVARTVR